MRIISVFHFPEFGGPHNQLLRLAGPFGNRDIESLAVLPEGPGAERLRSGGVQVEIVDLGRVRAVRDLRVQARMAARFPQDLWEFGRIFRSFQPDVVQLHGLMNPHAAIVARLLGIPVVWQLLDTRPPMPVRRAMMRPIRVLADVVMPIGHRVAAAHPGAETFGERMVVFYPPVDTEQFRPRPDAGRPLRAELGIAPQAPVVGVIGNINPQKGHEHFIAAAAIVRRSLPDAVFVIAGHIYPNHSDYYQSLLRLAESRGLLPGRDLFFLGSRADIPEILASIDVFALASVPNSEGTPTVILEAMACGVPVVATDVGSVQEVVDDGVTGYIVPSEQPAAMAGRLNELLTDKEWAERLGRAARERVEHEFSLEACVNTHISAYELAIAHRARRARKGTRDEERSPLPDEQP